MKLNQILGIAIVIAATVIGVHSCADQALPKSEVIQRVVLPDINPAPTPVIDVAPTKKPCPELKQPEKKSVAHHRTRHKHKVQHHAGSAHGGHHGGHGHNHHHSAPSHHLPPGCGP
jgi:hypothetical protein